MPLLFDGILSAAGLFANNTPVGILAAKFLGETIAAVLVSSLKADQLTLSGKMQTQTTFLQMRLDLLLIICYNVGNAVAGK